MSKLYELTEQHSCLADMMEEYFKQQAGIVDQDADPIDEQTVLDTLEAIDGEIEDKADGIAKILKNNQVWIDGMKAEEARLYARRKAMENSNDYLKKYLKENLEFIGKTKFKTLLFSFNIATNGGKQPITITENLGEIPNKYLIPQEPVVDKDAIRKLLEEKEVDWASLEPRGKNLRIR